jgi:hypothetical protein
MTSYAALVSALYGFAVRSSRDLGRGNCHHNYADSAHAIFSSWRRPATMTRFRPARLAA